MNYNKFILGVICWIFLWVISLVFLPLLKTRAEAPEIPLQDQPIENIVRHFAEVNGVDESLALAVMRCESQGRQDTVSDGGRSRGVFQYQKETFERHAKEYGEVLDYNSSYDQAKLAMWAIAHGKGNEWTAYRAIKNGGTYSFYSKQLKKHFTVKCVL